MIIEYTIATFWITYFGFVAIATLVICGWYAATRGYIEELPDGTIEKHGKILKAWYFFWMQERAAKRIVRYNNNNLQEIVDWISGYPTLVNNTYQLRGDKIKTSNQIPGATIRLIEKKYSVKVIEDSPTEYAVYKEYEQYRFPWWLRDMMAGCITCHATVYGNIIFWILLLLTKYSILGQEMFCFLDLPWYGFIGTWIMYWLTLAFTCTAAWKKF